MKKTKIAYWALTILFSLMLSMGAISYFMNYDKVQADFSTLGFPAFIIIPLAIAKLLGVIVILSNKFGRLKEWAYAGFTFNLLLATGAHLNVNDGKWFIPIIALVILMLSYKLSQKVGR